MITMRVKSMVKGKDNFRYKILIRMKVNTKMSLVKLFLCKSSSKISNLDLTILSLSFHLAWLKSFSIQNIWLLPIRKLLWLLYFQMLSIIHIWLTILISFVNTRMTNGSVTRQVLKYGLKVYKLSNNLRGSGSLYTSWKILCLWIKFYNRVFLIL